MFYRTPASGRRSGVYQVRRAGARASELAGSVKQLGVYYIYTIACGSSTL